MYVTAVLSSQTQGVIDVPAKAVFLFQGEQYVFVKTNTGEFSRQHIVPVASNESWVSVAQGLNKQDQVVVDGALFLQKILDDAGSAAAQAGTAQTPVVGQQSVK
jgi:cobalt-zinc-cadmium efflux system membrane fusion protein